MSALGGGCQLPLGALATHARRRAWSCRRWSALPTAGASSARRQQGRSPTPAALGDRVAGQLSRDGAVEILDEVRRQTESTAFKCTKLLSSTSSAPVLAIPRCMTVRGRECLANADVILHDHRVHRAALRAARPDAERIDVGAAAPKPLDQDAISYLLADKAREGKVVVRLKWGDPFVFDSGGKEAVFLHEQRIPFEVVLGSAR